MENFWIALNYFKKTETGRFATKKNHDIAIYKRQSKGSNGND